MATQFVALCRQLDLFADGIVVIDGSRFKAVNTREKNFTRTSIQRRMEQVEASIDRYLGMLETADRHDGEVTRQKSVRLKERLDSLRAQTRAFKALEAEVHAAPDQQVSLTDPDARAMATTGKGTGLVGYNMEAAKSIAETPDTPRDHAATSIASSTQWHRQTGALMRDCTIPCGLRNRWATSRRRQRCSYPRLPRGPHCNPGQRRRPCWSRGRQ